MSLTSCLQGSEREALNPEKTRSGCQLIRSSLVWADHCVAGENFRSVLVIHLRVFEVEVVDQPQSPAIVYVLPRADLGRMVGEISNESPSMGTAAVIL